MRCLTCLSLALLVGLVLSACEQTRPMTKTGAGAGSAGCVLANRLTEDANTKD